MINTSEAQFFKKLKKKAEQAAQRTIERKVEKKTEEKTSEAFDSIFGPGNKRVGTVNRDPNKTPPSDDAPNASEMSETDTTEELKIYSNFTFVPGDKILMYDDLSIDQIGDFPANWDTNGSGEVVTFDNAPQKWLGMSNRSVYLPLHDQLPDTYTVEFDIASYGLSRQTGSVARMDIWLDEENGFKRSANRTSVSLPFCQYINIGISISKHTNNKQILRNTIQKEIRQVMTGFVHVSIAVNKSRFRLWINEKKMIDVPRLVNEGKANYIKLHSTGFKDNVEQIFISNFKIAEGGDDYRSMLQKDGKFSTTGILFDSGSSIIKPESYGVLKAIAAALKDEAGNIHVVGHTDADGEEAFNLKLSQQRADAVKNILVNDFGLAGSSITTSGKGEKEPVADNSNSAGKAQNRRVEFIKE